VRGVSPPTVTVCFTPGEDCEGRIVQVIGEPRKQILIQAYGFTSPPILDAIKKAADSGVELLVILDKSNDRGRSSGATFMQNAGIPVWIDTAPGIAHNKVMVIDRTLTITGSYNFTRSAEKRNAENLLVISSRPVAARFEANWNARLKSARAYNGLPDPAQTVGR
jgi:phospholipase D